MEGEVVGKKRRIRKEAMEAGGRRRFVYYLNQPYLRCLHFWACSDVGVANM